MVRALRLTIVGDDGAEKPVYVPVDRVCKVEPADRFSRRSRTTLTVEGCLSVVYATEPTENVLMALGWRVATVGGGAPGEVGE